MDLANSVDWRTIEPSENRYDLRIQVDLGIVCVCVYVSEKKVLNECTRIYLGYLQLQKYGTYNSRQIYHNISISSSISMSCA